MYVEIKQEFVARPYNVYGFYDNVNDEYDEHSDSSIGLSNSKNVAGLAREIEKNLSTDSGDINNNVYDWKIPKVKERPTGPPISSGLAKLINTACTVQCETEDDIKSYPIPENCKTLNPPMVNEEVWKILDKRTRSYDYLFSEIQAQLAAGTDCTYSKFN
ncbi:hypothetical protein ACF0H5_018381 [Mactra antiquata]